MKVREARDESACISRRPHAADFPTAQSLGSHRTAMRSSRHLSAAGSNGLGRPPSRLQPPQRMLECFEFPVWRRGPLVDMAKPRGGAFPLGEAGPPPRARPLASESISKGPRLTTHSGPWVGCRTSAEAATSLEVMEHFFACPVEYTIESTREDCFMTRLHMCVIGASIALFSVGSASAQDKTPMPSQKDRPAAAAPAPDSMSTGRSGSMGKSNPASPSNPAPASETGKPSGGKENPKIGQ
jgi:hypothetical protein